MGTGRHLCVLGFFPVTMEKEFSKLSCPPVAWGPRSFPSFSSLFLPPSLGKPSQPTENPQTMQPSPAGSHHKTTPPLLLASNPCSSHQNSRGSLQTQTASPSSTLSKWSTVPCAQPECLRSLASNCVAKSNSPTSVFIVLDFCTKQSSSPKIPSCFGHHISQLAPVNFRMKQWFSAEGGSASQGVTSGDISDGHNWVVLALLALSGVEARDVTKHSTILRAGPLP